MENVLFTRYVVLLVDIVERACNVGMLGKVRGGGAECGLDKDNRYMPEDGHLVAIKL